MQFRAHVLTPGVSLCRGGRVIVVDTNSEPPKQTDTSPITCKFITRQSQTFVTIISTNILYIVCGFDVSCRVGGVCLVCAAASCCWLAACIVTPLSVAGVMRWIDSGY